MGVLNGKHNVLSGGFSSLAASQIVTSNAHAALKSKAPGETKVVAVMGDYWHNPVSQEVQIRNIFSHNKNWRIIFIRSNRFFTPELLSDTDLLINSRSSAPEHIDWSAEGLAQIL